MSTTVNRREHHAHERGKATKAALLSVTIEILDEVGEANIKLDEILRRAEASPSSLYHHFGNLRGLIDEAQAERFAGLVLKRTEEFAGQIVALDTAEKFADATDFWLREVAHGHYRNRRLARADALGGAYSNQEFARRLGETVLGAYRRLGEVLRDAPNRDIFRADFDADTFAAIFDGLSYSRVLVELTADEALAESWDRTIRELVYVLLFGPRAQELLRRNG